MPTAPQISIAYLTCRRDPHFSWWAESLHRETGGDYTGIRIVVVDFYAEAHKPEDPWTAEQAQCRREGFAALFKGHKVDPEFVHSSPIWNPWQGPHRLTRENWFAKADYLNAAVALTPGDWLVSCDDLSVLMPGWLVAVREAVQAPGMITCGSYRKVACLAVRHGEVRGWRPLPNNAGTDIRWAEGNDHIPVSCNANRMYGCSFVAPIDLLLKVNGWPQMSNGLGFEDSPMGIVLGRAGAHFRYDRRMFTLESEEDHHIGPVMKRSDYGDSPNDKSHAFLALCKDRTLTRFENYFGPEGLFGVRHRVLMGEPLPIIREPQHEWYTKRPLSEL